MNPRTNRPERSPLNPSPQTIRRIALGGFLGTWIILGSLISYLHWTNAFYAAVLLTPILTCIVVRMIHFKRRGLRFLPFPQALCLYGWSAVTLISLLVLFYTFELWRGKWAYARFVKTLEKDNVSLDVNSLAPPPISDNENLCETRLLACLIKGNHNSSLALGNYTEIAPSEELERIRSLSLPNRRPQPKPQWFHNQPTDLRAWARVFPKSTSTPSDSRAQTARTILNHLSPFSEVVTELQQAALDRGHGRWNLPYERGWFVQALTGQRDQVLENLISVLSLRSTSFLATNQTQAAINDLILGFRLVATVKSEPSIHTQVRRISWLFTLIQPLWEGLASHSWTPEQLSRVQTELSEIDLLQDAHRLRNAEALLNMDLWDQVDQAYSWHFLASNFQALLKKDEGARLLFGALWQAHPKGWSYQNKIETYRWFFPESPSKRSDRTVDPMCSIFIIPKLNATTRELEEYFPRCHTTLQQAILACALQQFYHNHQTYPDSLTDLTPKHLPSVPKSNADDSSSLKYHRLSDHSFLLAPSSVTDPSPTFEATNSPHLHRFPQIEWDQVWRYPFPEPDSTEFLKSQSEPERFKRDGSNQ